MSESRGHIEFVTLLVSGRDGTLTLWVPREASSALGTRGRVSVKGTLNGRPLRAAAIPDGTGTHTVQLDREQQDLFGVRAGFRVKVVLELGKEEAPVEVPPDLHKVLHHNVRARSHWEKFSSPQRRAWVEYIAEAKKPEARARRIEESVQRIALGKQP